MNISPPRMYCKKKRQPINLYIKKHSRKPINLYIKIRSSKLIHLYLHKTFLILQKINKLKTES